jgi:hypothetical protein
VAEKKKKIAHVHNLILNNFSSSCSSHQQRQQQKYRRITFDSKYFVDINFWQFYLFSWAELKIGQFFYGLIKKCPPADLSILFDDDDDQLHLSWRRLNCNFIIL